MILEHGQVEIQSVAFEYRLQFVPAPVQIDAGALVGVLAQASPVAVTENIGEKHFCIIARRLKEHDIGVAVLMLVAIHADPHPGMDDGAECLREDDRQAAIVERLAFLRIAPGRQFGVERNQRVDAKYQFGAFLEGDRGMQCLDQRAIHVIVIADAHRREEAGQGGAGLNGDRDRYIVMSGGTKGDGFAGIEIGRYQKEFALELAEIVGATAPDEEIAHHAIDTAVVEDTGRNGSRKPLKGLEQAVMERVAEIVLGGGKQEVGY